MISAETRRVRDAADKRRIRAERKHAAFTLTGKTCACGATATCLAVRVEHLPARPNSLSHHGWTISSQRVRDELTTREPACRPCASKRAHTSRMLMRDPIMMARRVRESLHGI